MWLSPDSVEYLDPESINGLNLYYYCMCNPTMIIDKKGNQQKFIDWFNFSNCFDLTATLFQLIIGGAAIGGQHAVLTAVRPDNIGVVYGVTMWLTGALGAKLSGVIGSFIPIPVVGTAIGFVIGVAVGIVLELEITGKTIMDHVRDFVYDSWKWLFK